MSISVETLALAKKYVETVVAEGGGVIIVDTVLSPNSTNPVQNKILYFEIENLKNKIKQNTNYNNLQNKPSVNGVILEGEKTLKELGIDISSSITNGNLLFNNKEISVYSLPKASVEEIGGVKIGKGLSVDNNGVLSVNTEGLTIVEWDKIQNKPNTIGGYGITDLEIIENSITIGNKTITPVVDNNYIHTDNNYTNQDKNIVSKAITTEDVIILNG